MTPTDTTPGPHPPARPSLAEPLGIALIVAMIGSNAVVVAEFVLRMIARLP